MELQTTATPGLWTGFILFVMAMLALDLLIVSTLLGASIVASLVVARNEVGNLSGGEAAGRAS